ncbi:hypothetical protein WJX79_004447 [Trebouxia sp. C0005]
MFDRMNEKDISLVLILHDFLCLEKTGRRSGRHRQAPPTHSFYSSAPAKAASGLRSGLVGPDRFQDGALPGTYFGPNDQCAESIEIQFQIGTDDELGIHVPVGSSLLQAAELSGAVKPNRDFCFEGSCELCQLEVKDGAQELGPKAQHGVQELVRSCLTAVPRRQNGLVHVKVLSEESVWAEGVL